MGFLKHQLITWFNWQSEEQSVKAAVPCSKLTVGCMAAFDAEGCKIHQHTLVYLTAYTFIRTTFPT